jgi:RNA polymerase sigma-70 factor, ECF subfamily
LRRRFPSQHTLQIDSDQRLEAATDEALAELSSEDRFTLASYYLDGRTLAEIARTLGLHESSVSRRLDRLATGLRKRILAGLRMRGMSHAQARKRWKPTCGTCS